MHKLTFKIEGFHCESCVKLATMKIKKIAGVENVNIQANGESVIEANREIGLEEISQAVEAVGYTVVEA